MMAIAFVRSTQSVWPVACDWVAILNALAAAAAAAAAATCDAIDEPIRFSSLRASVMAAALCAPLPTDDDPIKFSNLRVSGLYIGCLNLQCVRKLSLRV